MAENRISSPSPYLDVRGLKITQVSLKEPVPEEIKILKNQYPLGRENKFLQFRNMHFLSSKIRLQALRFQEKEPILELCEV